MEKRMFVSMLSLLCLLACSAFISPQLTAEEVQCKWKACKWGTREHASIKIDGRVVVLRYARSGEKVKKAFTFYASPAKETSLDGYKYLSLRARSANGKAASIYLYINRKDTNGKSSSFYSILNLTPEWANYNLRLKTAARSMVGKGFFVRSKAAAGASRQLASGGKIVTLGFYTKTAEIIEVSDIKLEKDLDKDSPEVRQISEAIKNHKKFAPYVFQDIIGAAGPVLVDKGKSPFSICIAGGIGETGKFAASELAEYIEKSTGVKLPVIKQFSPGRQIILLSVKPDKNEQEGFATQALSANKIEIIGNNERGLLYGVYDFLEKAVGIRWFAPFDYAVVVPKKQNVKLPLWKDSSVPKMMYRRFHYCSAGRMVPEPMKHRYVVADWCVKNRYNVELERLVSSRDKPNVKKANLARISSFYAKRGGCIALPTMWGHNYHFWIPPKEYFAKKPEFFCQDSSTGKWRAERAQLCATNPELAKTIARKAVSYFKEHPERIFFPLFQEDGARLWCQCPGCRALYKGGNSNTYKTEHSINLANLVAAELAKVMPGKKIVTYAYNVTSQPPKNVTPRDDVFITYCLTDFSSPDRTPWAEFGGKELQKWNKLCNGNLFLYTYNYLDFYYTANTPGALVRTFRFFDLLKVKCSCQESNENWYGVSAYNYYLSARLAWNPWFEEAAFRKDYYDKLYGKASIFIENYHTTLAECLCEKKNWLEYGNRSLPYIPAKKMNSMREYLEQAVAAGKGNVRVAGAVAAQLRGFDFVKAFSAAVTAGADFQKTLEPRKYQKAIASLEHLERVSKRLGPDRLVPTQIVFRQIQGFKRNMREIYESNSSFKTIQKKYDFLGKLPGQWSFKTDPLNKGDREKWMGLDFNYADWSKINIGNWWGKQGYGNYLGSAWYRTALDIPSGRKKLGLYFCGVDERAWVYLDGNYIGGHHKGDVKKLWNEPFFIELPAGLKPGLHELTVKVHASGGQGGIWKPVYLLAEK